MPRPSTSWLQSDRDTLVKYYSPLEKRRMSKTTRRDLLKVAGAGTVAAGLGAITKAETTKSKTAGHKDHHKALSGPLASATVSFGQWDTDPPFDRMAAEVLDPPGPPNLPPTGGQNDFTRNVHALLPNEVTIKAGGSVNFIVAGFHQILIYENVSGPSDINSANLIPASPPFFPPLVNDPNNRIYRGLDPRPLTLQDRVEVVNFPNPGRYLAICGVLPHFAEMFGWVRVLP